MGKPGERDTLQNLDAPAPEEADAPAVNRFKYRTDSGANTAAGDADRALLRGLSRARQKIDDRENSLGPLLDQVDQMSPPATTDAPLPTQHFWTAWTVVPVRGRRAWLLVLYGAAASAVLLTAVVAAVKLVSTKPVDPPVALPATAVTPAPTPSMAIALPPTIAPSSFTSAIASVAVTSPRPSATHAPSVATVKVTPPASSSVAPRPTGSTRPGFSGEN